MGENSMNDTTDPDDQLVSIQAGDSPGDVYSVFNAFASERFGAESDDLFYEYFGESLAIRDEPGYDGAGSVWSYGSTESATVAFETTLLATSHVEYRPAGNQTFEQSEPTERPFSVHIHHLTGLRPGTTYEWRPVAVDERGNELVGEVRTVETGRRQRVSHTPGGSER